jgi:hypothetical protein
VHKELKNEIAIERINYVTEQRNAIENALTLKINKKATLQAIKNMYDPLINQIHLELQLPKGTLITLNNLSSIVDSD